MLLHEKMKLFWIALIPALVIQALMKWICLLIVLFLLMGCNGEEIPSGNTDPDHIIDGS